MVDLARQATGAVLIDPDTGNLLECVEDHLVEVQFALQRVSLRKQLLALSTPRRVNLFVYVVELGLRLADAVTGAGNGAGNVLLLIRGGVWGPGCACRISIAILLQQRSFGLGRLKSQL